VRFRTRGSPPHARLGTIPASEAAWRIHVYVVQVT